MNYLSLLYQEQTSGKQICRFFRIVSSIHTVLSGFTRWRKVWKLQQNNTCILIDLKQIHMNLLLRSDVTYVPLFSCVALKKFLYKYTYTFVFSLVRITIIGKVPTYAKTEYCYYHMSVQKIHHQNFTSYIILFYLDTVLMENI